MRTNVSRPSRRWARILAGVGALLSLATLTHTTASTASPAPRSPSSGPVTAPPPAQAITAPAWSTYVLAENALVGSSTLAVTKTRGTTAGLEAYADHVSIRPGQPVGMRISSRWTHVTITALRAGDYDGQRFRNVWRGALTGHVQPKPVQVNTPLPGIGAKNTHMIVARWSTSTTIPTTGWPEGHYLLRVDAGTASRWVTLTVRSATTAGRVVIMTAPMTWNAYNTWGGRGLYGDGDENFAQRSYAVSFDRPNVDGFGAGRGINYDYGVLQRAEHLGLPLAWLTDYDIARDRKLLAGATAIVVGGHAEYWTGPMRDAVTAAVKGGTNLAVFGANTAYWRVRLAARNAAGEPRAVFGAKSAALDPLAKKDPGGTTARFKDAPAARAEEDLTGTRYDCFPAEGDWVIADASWWGYAGTGLRAGDRLKGVIGPESDRVYGGHAKPTTDVVAYTTFTCRGKKTAHTGVYWTNAAGAGIFNAGTMRWPARIDAAATHGSLRTITDNVLTAFATPAAGRTHPARPNVAHFWLPAASTSHAS